MNRQAKACRLLILGILLAVLGAARSAIAQTEFRGTTMGPIEYRVVIVDRIADQAGIGAGIDQRLAQVDQLMSTWIDSSDVSRVNSAPVGEWVDVDALTLTVVERALEISRITNGAFDVTVGPAVNLWHFGPEKRQDREPTGEEIESVKSCVGFGMIATRSDPPALSKTHVGTQLDLSAIAKGFAVDRVADFLAERSLRNFMVEVGGEVVARGKTDSGPWRIGIEKPVDAVREISSVVALRDRAMATSGDYRNFYILNGQRFSHMIDPQTCRPVRNAIASCTVIASDCMTADAFATAIMVMGVEAGMRIAEENELSVSILHRDPGDGATLSTTGSTDFPFAAESISADQADSDTSIWPAFVAALVVFGLAITGMAVGAIFNNRPITGSCGGIAAAQNQDGSSGCSLCQKPLNQCPDS